MRNMKPYNKHKLDQMTNCGLPQEYMIAPAAYSRLNSTHPTYSLQCFSVISLVCLPRPTPTEAS